MITQGEVLETNRMIAEENLDVRTITIGINLLDCIDPDPDNTCDRIYEKVTRTAEKQGSYVTSDATKLKLRLRLVFVKCPCTDICKFILRFA